MNTNFSSNMASQLNMNGLSLDETDFSGPLQRQLSASGNLNKLANDDDIESDPYFQDASRHKFELLGEAHFKFYTWYSANFQKKNTNYVFYCKHKNSVLILMVSVGEQYFYSSLMTEDGTFHGQYELQDLSPPGCLDFSTMEKRFRDHALQKMKYPIPSAMSLFCVDDEAVYESLLNYHRKMRGTKTVKAGVLFQQHDDDSEIDMYMNDGENESYQKFLRFSGKRIELKNWPKYAGGLDTVEGLSGKESVYSNYRGYEIMFHVSCLIELRDESDYLPRKRHIGNDVVVIVFQQNGCEFNPALIKSRQTHIVFIVSAIDSNSFKIETITRLPVPHFENISKVIKNNSYGQAYFWSIIIGAHNLATRYAPAFESREKKTRGRLLQAVIDRQDFLRDEL